LWGHSVLKIYYNSSLVVFLLQIITVIARQGGVENFIKPLWLKSLCCLSLFLVSIFVLTACSSYSSSALKDGSFSDVKISSNDQLLNQQIAFHVSGGIAGRDETLIIERSGKYHIKDNRLGISWSSHLLSDDSEELTNMLAKLDFSSDYKKGNSFFERCRDCLVYRLEIIKGTRKKEIVLDSRTLAKSFHHDLISFLMKLINHAKKVY